MSDKPKHASRGHKPFLSRTKTLVAIAGGLIGIITFFTGTMVQRRNAEKARTFGACNLRPQLPANLERLNGYIEEGERYAKDRYYALAANRFQKVLEADPNFLGAHQDLGVVRMHQGDLDSAQTNFEDEIKLIDCLRSTKDDLYRFAYPLISYEGKHLSERAYQNRINSAEDSAHYNLACVFARNGEFDAAIDELAKAATYGSIKQKIVEKDPDLNAIRHDPRFAIILAQFG